MFAKTVRWTAGLVLAVVAAAMVGTLLVPRAFGLTPYVVTSGSMRPSFDPGAVVLADDVADSTLQIGDVITFQTPDGVTTHRIVTCTTYTDATEPLLLLRTQGDANNAPDPEPVDARNVLGKVRVDVPAVGYLLERVREPVGIGSLLLLLGIVVFTGGGQRAERTEAEPEEGATTEPKAEALS
jgi:signal peptidase